MKTRSELSLQLYKMMVDRGYPENLCDLVSRNLNTEFTAARMIGQLSHYLHLPDVEIVDEIFTILADRNAIMKKESEKAQAAINEIYRYGLEIEQMLEEKKYRQLYRITCLRVGDSFVLRVYQQSGIS